MFRILETIYFVLRRAGLLLIKLLFVGGLAVAGLHFLGGGKSDTGKAPLAVPAQKGGEAVPAFGGGIAERGATMIETCWRRSARYAEHQLRADGEVQDENTAAGSLVGVWLYRSSCLINAASE